MRQIKFCHTADLHLGKQFNLGDDFSQRRIREAFDSFLDILEKCRIKNIDILLIAGDLFEARPSQKLLGEVIEAFESIRPVKIIISPGNHDYDSIDSAYRNANWPENVYIFHSDMERIDFKDLCVSVFGAAFNSSYVRESLDNIDWSKLSLNREEDAFKWKKLMVIHGELGVEDSCYNYIDPQKWPDNFFSYVALGHIHKGSPVLNCNNNLYAYSGVAFPLSFNDIGQKGVYIGTIKENICRVEYCPIKGPQYLQEEINIDSFTSNREIEEVILAHIKDIAGGEKNYYKIIIKGYKNKTLYADFASIEASIRERGIYVKIEDQSIPLLDKELLLMNPSPMASLMIELSNRLELSSDSQEKLIIRSAMNKAMEWWKEVGI